MIFGPIKIQLTSSIVVTGVHRLCLNDFFHILRTHVDLEDAVVGEDTELSADHLCNNP